GPTARTTRGHVTQRRTAPPCPSPTAPTESATGGRTVPRLRRRSTSSSARPRRRAPSNPTTIPEGSRAWRAARASARRVWPVAEPAIEEGQRLHAVPLVTTGEHVVRQ